MVSSKAYFAIPVSEKESVYVDLYDTRYVLNFGWQKHRGRGFQDGYVSLQDHFYACLRHLWKWFLLKTKDPETGASHLHHAHARILMMIYQEQQLNDD